MVFAPTDIRGATVARAPGDWELTERDNTKRSWRRRGNSRQARPGGRRPNIMKRIIRKLTQFRRPRATEVEVRALADSSNIRQLIKEVALGRLKLQREASKRVVQMDEMLSYLQYSHWRLLKDIVGNPGSAVFKEALASVTEVSEMVADAKGLQNYSVSLRTRMGHIEWLAMRATTYVEVAESMRTGRPPVAMPFLNDDLFNLDAGAEAPLSTDATNRVPLAI